MASKKNLFMALMDCHMWVRVYIEAVPISHHSDKYSVMSKTTMTPAQYTTLSNRHHTGRVFDSDPFMWGACFHCGHAQWVIQQIRWTVSWKANHLDSTHTHLCDSKNILVQNKNFNFNSKHCDSKHFKMKSFKGENFRKFRGFVALRKKFSPWNWGAWHLLAATPANNPRNSYFCQIAFSLESFPLYGNQMSACWNLFTQN